MLQKTGRKEGTCCVEDKGRKSRERGGKRPNKVGAKRARNYAPGILGTGKAKREGRSTGENVVSQNRGHRKRRGEGDRKAEKTMVPIPVKNCGWYT